MKQFLGSLFGSKNKESDQEEDLSVASGSGSETSSSTTTPSENNYSESNSISTGSKKRNPATKRVLPSASSLDNATRFSPNKRTKIFTSGSNDSAQLGFKRSEITTMDEWKEVTQIQGLSEVESEEILSRVNIISVGRSHSLIATQDGLVFGCGKNNYNQLSQIGGEYIELFTPLNQYLLTAMSDSLKEIIRSHNWSEKQESFITKHFSRIETVDFISCGWFHTLIIVNRNIILGSGHSYFSQLFGADFKASYQVLNNTLSIFKQSVNDINPYETYCVTDLACGTFSSAIVFNRSVIYSCGETAWKNGGLFQVPDTEALKYPITKLGQTDAGVYAQLEDNSLHFISKDRLTFEMLETSVRAFAGGHMSNASNWVNNKSPLDKPVISTNENKQNDLFSGYCELGSMNIQLFGGYYCSFGTINKKILFTQGGKYTGVTKETLPFKSPYCSVVSPASLSSNKALDRKLAELLFHERYDILDVQSGCDVNMLLIAEFRGSTDHFKQKLLNQTVDENLHKFSDISFNF